MVSRPPTAESIRRPPPALAVPTAEGTGARSGDHFGPGLARAGILAGGLLVVLSVFLPWSVPVDSSYRSSAAGSDLGLAAILAMGLGAGLTSVVVLPAAARRVPALGRVATRGRLPVPAAGTAMLLAGGAVLAVVVVWLTMPAFVDPVLPARSMAGRTRMPATAGTGLYAALAGTSAELAACAWAVRRPQRP
ncbi:hypothetical protein MXD63_11220 [Frankia sp. Cpl3]|uniref:hypothetical protein n=1 Tax=Parafrankia colletiae TaxID=573497 RepID=UPI000E2F553D|nr:hypothetical protein [Parafrankia colletiae]MCK9900646.1 hypothetical protein [Frankia sp. Cpl3]